MTDTATSPVAGPLEPLTQQRLEAQLSGLNLQYFRNEEGLTVTAFPGMACFGLCQILWTGKPVVFGCGG